MLRKRPYTILEAARKLGISRAAVHEAIKSGRLRAWYKVMKLRAWLIDPAEIRSYRVSILHQEVGKKQYFA